MTQGATTVSAYFPAGKWYDYYTLVEYLSTGTGLRTVLDAPLDYLPLHVRGGYILPQQEPAYTTAESRANPFSLIVALDAAGTATGSLYLDDGCGASIRVSWAVASTALAETDGSMTAARRGPVTRVGRPDAGSGKA